MFNNTRLTIARQRASLTKKELAEKVGVEPRAVSGFEAGQYQPSEATALRIAEVLGYPVGFFLSDDIDLLSVDNVSFRSMSKMTAKQRDAAVAAGSIALVLSEWVDKEFDLPGVDVPDFGGAEPEMAAMSLREYWGLGLLPIVNMIHLLELKGVRVFSLDEKGAEVDAYSAWHGVRPFVFLNVGKSGERRRFDAAHELAHLVLHRHAALVGPEAEKEAHAFASAFLMPEASLRAIGRVAPNLDFIIAQKQKWMVSAAAMTVRLYSLGLLTYYHYNRLFVEISTKGYRKSEPMPMRPEVSQVWRKVFDALLEDGIGLRKLAEELKLPVDEITRLVFGLVTIPIPASDNAALGPRVSHLRVVK